ALCVLSRIYVDSMMWKRIGHAAHTPRILVFSTRFTKLAPDGHRLPSKFHSFASAFLVCLHKLHRKPRSHPSQERRYCFRAWRVVRSIELRSLRARGATRLVSKWPAPVCATTIIRRHPVTMR